MASPLFLPSGSRAEPHATRESVQKRAAKSPQPPAPFDNPTAALCPLLPAAHVALLVGGQVVNLDTHRRELVAGDVLFDFDGHRVDLGSQLALVLDTVLRRERLR